MKEGNLKDTCFRGLKSEAQLHTQQWSAVFLAAICDRDPKLDYTTLTFLTPL